MKRFITGAILTSLVLGMVIVPAVGRAEGNNSLAARLQALLEQVAVLKARLTGSGASAIPPSVGTGVAVSAEGFAQLSTAFPEGEDDGDFVQFNNLRIQAIALAPEASADRGTAIITAAQDFGIRCQKFESEASSVARPLPCPLPAERVYTIRTDAETRFFLRDRTRATLADMAVGDAINVYGYLLRATKGIQALVVRDLDKPVTDKFFQLNNVEVLTAPAAPDAPTTFVVGQRGVSPCLDFGERGVSGVSAPCPLGIEAAEKTNILSPSFMPPIRKYVIAITKDTKIVNRDRLAMAIRDIATGDTVNIYGKIRATDRATIEAAVVRDTSKPTSDRAGALRVIVSDTTSACPEPATNSVSDRPTLCGIIYTAGVALMDASGATIAKASTETGAALFEQLAPGNYVVLVSAPGYEEVKRETRIDLRGETLLGVILRPRSSGITISTDSKLTGTAGSGFTATFVAAGGGGAYEWSITEGALPPGLDFVVPISRGPVIMCIKAPCPQPGSNRAIVKGTLKMPGTYPFAFMATDASGRSGSARFTITVLPAETNAPLACAPEFWQVGSGGTAYLSASGGDGTYAWSAPDGGVLMVTAGASNEFSMTNTGNVPVIARVNVASAGQTKTCKVRVMTTTQPPLVCTPAVQQVAGGRMATMNVGINFPTNAGAPVPESIIWSAPDGTPSGGIGLTFATMFRNTTLFVQVRPVSVRTGDRSGTCLVRVSPEGNTQGAGVIER